MEIKAGRLVESTFMSYAACMDNPQPDSLNPFLALQENAGELFNQIHARHSSKMQCQSGCSRCCHAEFSVFSGEALIILRWFQNLEPELKKATLELWAQAPQIGACQFLRNDRCTIYEARPMICRTQGAPLKFAIEKKKEVTQTLDCCPLNFDGGKQIPKTPSDWFDLDRLTSLQTIAERYTSKNFEIPAELKALFDQDDRVPLRTLQKLLNEK